MSVPVAGQGLCVCACVDMRWMINPPYSWMRRITVHAAFLHDTVFWVAFCLTPSLIQHPDRPVCRSAVTTLASLTVSVPPTDRLPLTSSFVCAVHSRPKHLSFSPPHVRVFDVLHSSGVALLHFVAALCRRRAAVPTTCHPPPPLS